MNLKGNIKITIENVDTKKIEIVELHNVSCSAGMESLASRMVGAIKGEVTYFAVGTGTNAPAKSDVKLQTEIERKQISVRSATGDTAYFRIFFNTTEANGTLKEIGLFGDDASVTKDTGTLFARAAINKTKTTSETLTIDWSLKVE